MEICKLITKLAAIGALLSFLVIALSIAYFIAQRIGENALWITSLSLR